MNEVKAQPSVIHSSHLKQWSIAAVRVKTVLVVGAGRWGRVWIRVAASIASEGASLGLVARSNFAETLEWLESAPELRRIHLFASLIEAEEWLRQQSGPRLAVIASRPRDHESDTLALLASVDGFYVEKPLTTDFNSVSQFLSKVSKPVFAGHEFGMIPEFHSIATALAEERLDARTITLTWNDPMDEQRHGGLKRRHDEIDLLDDIWPHAFSIFRIFTPLSFAKVVSAEQLLDRSRLKVVLQSTTGCLISLEVERGAPRRVRSLRVGVDGDETVTVDFSRSPGSVSSTLDRLSTPSDIDPLLSSSLRISLGAIVESIHKEESGPEQDLHLMASLGGEIRKML